MAYHPPANFNNHSHYGSGDVVLVCDLISQDRAIKGSRDFTGSSSLVALCTLLVEI